MTRTDLLVLQQENAELNATVANLTSELDSLKQQLDWFQGSGVGVKRPAFVAMLRFTPALYSDPTNLSFLNANHLLSQPFLLFGVA